MFSDFVVVDVVVVCLAIIIQYGRSLFFYNFGPIVGRLSKESIFLSGGWNKFDT